MLIRLTTITTAHFQAKNNHIITMITIIIIIIIIAKNKNTSNSNVNIAIVTGRKNISS